MPPDGEATQENEPSPVQFLTSKNPEVQESETAEPKSPAPGPQADVKPPDDVKPPSKTFDDIVKNISEDEREIILKRIAEEEKHRSHWQSERDRELNRADKLREEIKTLQSQLQEKQQIRLDADAKKWVGERLGSNLDEETSAAIAPVLNDLYSIILKQQEELSKLGGVEESFDQKISQTAENVLEKVEYRLNADNPEFEDTYKFNLESFPDYVQSSDQLKAEFHDLERKYGSAFALMKLQSKRRAGSKIVGNPEEYIHRDKIQEYLEAQKGNNSSPGVDLSQVPSKLGKIPNTTANAGGGTSFDFMMSSRKR